MQKPKQPVKKPQISCKIERKKAKAEEAEGETLKQQAKGERWKGIFADTPLLETKLSARDPLQSSMLQYAETMGIPTEGIALTDNFAR